MYFLNVERRNGFLDEGVLSCSLSLHNTLLRVCMDRLSDTLAQSTVLDILFVSIGFFIDVGVAITNSVTIAVGAFFAEAWNPGPRYDLALFITRFEVVLVALE